MSGGYLPYHLRHNKAIERNVFIDLLSRIKGIRDYQYIGFGGPFLEDFRLIHFHLGIKNMTCVEMDEEVHKRQDFNSPIGCITLLHKRSGEFITEFTFTGNSIIWLDYASSRALGEQLSEVHTVIQKLNTYDIIKVTLNANPNTLLDESILKSRINDKDKPEVKEEETDKFYEERLAVLQERAGLYLPTTINREEITQGGYPSVLCRALRNAIQRGLSNIPDQVFQPLTSFIYSDSNHQMLTFTGIILPNKEAKKNEFFEYTKISDWKFRNLTGETSLLIDIPELSIKERFEIDRLLPGASTQKIHEKLKFFIAENEDKSKMKIDNYILYYRQYPYFSKILP